MGSSAYTSNGVLQADWVDDHGNLIHQWWNPDGGWVLEVLTGPDGTTEVRDPASSSWGVTWILDQFGDTNRIDLFTVTDDGAGAIHAWAKAGDRWHSERFDSPAR